MGTLYCPPKRGEKSGYKHSSHTPTHTGTPVRPRHEPLIGPHLSNYNYKFISILIYRHGRSMVDFKKQKGSKRNKEKWKKEKVEKRKKGKQEKRKKEKRKKGKKENRRTGENEKRKKGKMKKEKEKTNGLKKRKNQGIEKEKVYTNTILDITPLRSFSFAPSSPRRPIFVSHHITSASTPHPAPHHNHTHTTSLTSHHINRARPDAGKLETPTAGRPTRERQTACPACCLLLPALCHSPTCPPSAGCQ